MADTTVTLDGPGAGGATLDVDDIGGTVTPYSKLKFGASGTATHVTASVGLPVDIKASVTLTETNSGTIAGDTTSIDGKITACDTGAVVISSGTVTANAGTGDYLSVAGHTRNEAFKESMAIGGELDDTTPVVATEGNVSPARITAQRALHANLRSNDGTELGTTGNPVVVTDDGSAILVDGSAVTQPVSGTVTANPASGTIDTVTNLAQMGGAALAMNTGVRSAGTQRVTVATDDLVPISAASLPLPTGAATSANQSTGNTSLSNIDTAVQLIDNAAVAHDAAAGSAGVNLIGLEGRNTEPTAVGTTGDATRAMGTMLGKQVTVPYAIPASTWSYASPAAVADTADDVAQSAGGAGVRHYVTGVQVFNGHDTVGTEVVIKDGATVIWRGWAEETGGGCSARFDPPLRGTAATALNVANITTGSATYFNLQGYDAAE